MKKKALISLTGELLDSVDKIAAKLGITRSGLVCMALWHYLECDQTIYSKLEELHLRDGA